MLYYSDMPYSASEDLRKVKEMATNEPSLMLMKQNGDEERGELCFSQNLWWCRVSFVLIKNTEYILYKYD